MKYVTSLDFTEEPDYDYCKRLFFELIADFKQQGIDASLEWLSIDSVVLVLSAGHQREDV